MKEKTRDGNERRKDGIGENGTGKCRMNGRLERSEQTEEMKEEGRKGEMLSKKKRERRKQWGNIRTRRVKNKEKRKIGRRKSSKGRKERKN